MHLNEANERITGVFGTAAPKPFTFSRAEYEARSNLRELPPGPWRSMGRYLDYTNWSDRCRFLELDRAIGNECVSHLAQHRYEPAAQAARAPFKAKRPAHQWDLAVPSLRRIAG